uniref:Uncharacterized protein n=1 Tax=Glossina pallidipes TaxID=7398 RepID=A0A1A9Z5K0_GLOPL
MASGFTGVKSNTALSSPKTFFISLNTQDIDSWGEREQLICLKRTDEQSLCYRMLLRARDDNDENQMKITLFFSIRKIKLGIFIVFFGLYSTEMCIQHFLSSARQQWNLIFAQHLPSLSNEDKQKRTSHSSSYVHVNINIELQELFFCLCVNRRPSSSSSSSPSPITIASISQEFVKNLNDDFLSNQSIPVSILHGSQL